MYPKESPARQHTNMNRYYVRIASRLLIADVQEDEVTQWFWDRLLEEPIIDGDESPEFFFCLGWLCFCWNGRQTFVVGKHFGEMLVNTSLRGVMASDVNLPYRAFHVNFSSSDLTFDCRFNTDDGYLSDLGVVVCSAFVVSDPSWIDLIIGGPYDDEMIGRPIYRCRLDRGSLKDVEDSLSWHREQVGDSVIHVARIVFNLIQYLDSEGSESRSHSPRSHQRRVSNLRSKLNKAKSELKRQRIRDQILSVPAHTVTWVGESIDKTAREMIRASASSKVRHWVRGHWKLQSHGSGRLLRKRIWIQPYLRCDGTESPASREYRFREQRSHR